MKVVVRGIEERDVTIKSTGEIVHLRNAFVEIFGVQREGLVGNPIETIKLRFDPKLLKIGNVYNFDTVRSSYNGKVRIYADSFDEAKA